MRGWTWLFAVISVVSMWGPLAAAQGTRPTLVPYPLELDPSPALSKVASALRTAYFEHLRDRSGVLTPTKQETESAFSESRRQDCGESNECLAQLAAKAGTLYGLYASLAYSAKRQLVLSGRVVRDDGKLMGTAVVQSERGKASIVEATKKLLKQLAEQLALQDLPTFKEVPVVSGGPKVESPPVPAAPRLPVAPPPPAPPLVVATAASPARIVGSIMVPVGAVAAALGGVVFAAAGTASVDAYGNVASSDVSAVRTVRGWQTAGVALMAGGVGTAVAGGILWALSSDSPKVALVPSGGGFAFVVGGTFE